ncbi:hypothetical protein HYS28_00230 [Candidatus Uhrbacteria bacterium]|nr:hypothetical protein [Candidatus Uhrbacteria bacterium]
MRTLFFVLTHPNVLVTEFKVMFDRTVILSALTGATATNAAGLGMLLTGAPDLPISAYFTSAPHLIFISLLGAGLGAWARWVWRGDFDKPQG